MAASAAAAPARRGWRGPRETPARRCSRSRAGRAGAAAGQTDHSARPTRWPRPGCRRARRTRPHPTDPRHGPARPAASAHRAAPAGRPRPAAPSSLARRHCADARSTGPPEAMPRPGSCPAPAPARRHRKPAPAPTDAHRRRGLRDWRPPKGAAKMLTWTRAQMTQDSKPRKCRRSAAGRWRPIWWPASPACGATRSRPVPAKRSMCLKSTPTAGPRVTAPGPSPTPAAS
mmetsp:Transcript_4996/g.18199  ORF Transcript_4996/g.18199 Transcript_4996/m.18199 type:complete len:230 (+) Transcript_4996:2947-3636(+)